MNICIARLRSGVNYTVPNHHIMDSFYELLKRYTYSKQDRNWLFYNFGFGWKPRRDLDAVRSADVVIIPTENEFHYHIPGYIHTLDWRRSQAEVAQIAEVINNKHLVIMTNDRADNEQLFVNKVFPGVKFKSIGVLDEIDFPRSIHQMKYYFIKQSTQMFQEQKVLDFVYWGSIKNKLPGPDVKAINSGDERAVILKQIKRNEELKSYFIGRFAGFDADMKMQKGMEKILPILRQGRATLCFNWLSDTATTARYHEAIACNVVPLVWKDYDKNNLLVRDERQRVYTIEGLFDKLLQLSNPIAWAKFIGKIRSSYENDLLSQDQLADIFAYRMDKLLS